MGGSALAFPETLAKVRALTGLTIVLPGHEPPGVLAAEAQKKIDTAMPLSVIPRWKRFEEYADFTRELVAAIVNARRAGKATPEAAVSGLTLSERFTEYDMRGAAAFAAVIYAESTPQP